MTDQILTDKNGFKYRRGCDGDREYLEPSTGKWNLRGDVNIMNHKALCAAMWREGFGCEPNWNGYFGDWCCSCRGNIHGSDSQCSIVAVPKVQIVAKRIEELGGTPPSASCDIDTFMRALLELIRGPRPVLVR